MMYNTGNPVGSDDARDFIDDVVVVDNFTTLQQRTSPDRLGVQRNTLFGIEQEGKDAAEAMGWFPVAGSFEAGGTITARNQVLQYAATGAWYSWRGALPKTVAPGSTPATSGGFGATAWIDRTDATLRTQLLKRPLRAAMSDIYGLADHVSVKDYGAIGDGTIHTLQEWVDSGRFSGLAAIQAAYPHVTSLTQSIDWAAIQAAIATGRSVWNPKGDYWISNEIEQVTPGQVIEFEGTGGYGYGSFATLRSGWVPNTRWIAYGSGFTSDARVRTRRKYRASAADPQDAAMSVVLNIQAEGVVLVRPCVWLNCNYSNSSPTNLGDACDVGIFVGCRVGVKMVDPQVIGYFRMSGIHYDVTHDTELPRHLDKKGVPYPIGQNVGGADGASIYNPFVIGARRGVVVAGSLPAPGNTWYGPAYYDQQLGATVADSRGNFGFSDFIVHEGRIFGPEHHSGRRLADPTVSGGSLNQTSLEAENDLMPCAMFIDGMAGNGNKVVHGMRFIGTRFSSLEAFRVRLGRAARPMFIGCHVEGSSGTVYDTSGNVINTNDLNTVSYGHYAGAAISKKLTILGGLQSSNTNSGMPHYYGSDLVWLTEAGDLYSNNLKNRDGDPYGVYLNEVLKLLVSSTTVTLGAGVRMTATDGDFDVAGADGFGLRVRNGAATICRIESAGISLSGTAGTVQTSSGELDLRAADTFTVRMRSGANTVAVASSTEIIGYGTKSIIRPSDDNVSPFGMAGARGTTIYLGTAPNVTSDERHKTDIKPIDDAALDAWGNVNYYQYELVDGTSGRKHTGCIVQRIIKAFADAGLDALEYGLCCHESWDAKPATYETIAAVIDEDGNVVTPERTVLIEPAREAGDIWTLRYDEAYAFEAAYQRRRADILEARITAIEGRLAELEAK